jgi:hypothetical protein
MGLIVQAFGSTARISAAGMSTALISVFAVRGERSPYRTGAKIQYFAQTLVRTAH